MDRRSRHLAILPWDICFHLRIYLGANSAIFVLFLRLSGNKTTAGFGECFRELNFFYDYHRFKYIFITYG